MAATDKSRQTCLAATRTPTPIVVLKFMVLSFQQIVVNVSIPKTTSDTFQLTIRLNIPTIQALESHKITTNNPTTTEKDQQQQLQTLVSFVNPNIISLQQWNLPVAISPSPDIRDKQSLPLQIPSPDKITCKPHNDPTITMTARSFLCNPQPSDRAPAPRSDSKLARQFVSLKSSRSSSIPRNVPQIRNNSSESYTSTSELPNDSETFLFVSTTSLCRFSAHCPLTDLLQPRYHEDHNPTAPSPIPL